VFKEKFNCSIRLEFLKVYWSTADEGTCGHICLNCDLR